MFANGAVRHRLAADTLRIAVAPDLLRKRLQLSRRAFELIDILGERVFRADRFADAVGFDLALVNATGDAVEIGSRLAEK